jgi:hypothetical protein
MSTVRPSKFFKLAQNPAKQLNLRDSSGGLALMLKLASERKRVCLIPKIQSPFIPEVEAYL